MKSENNFQSKIKNRNLKKPQANNSFLENKNFSPRAFLNNSLEEFSISNEQQSNNYMSLSILNNIQNTLQKSVGDVQKSQIYYNRGKQNGKLNLQNDFQSSLETKDTSLTIGNQDRQKQILQSYNRLDKKNSLPFLQSNNENQNLSNLSKLRKDSPQYFQNLQSRTANLQKFQKEENSHQSKSIKNKPYQDLNRLMSSSILNSQQTSSNNNNQIKQSDPSQKEKYSKLNNLMNIQFSNHQLSKISINQKPDNQPQSRANLKKSTGIFNQDQTQKYNPFKEKVEKLVETYAQLNEKTQNQERSLKIVIRILEKNANYLTNLLISSDFKSQKLQMEPKEIIKGLDYLFKQSTKFEKVSHEQKLQFINEIKISLDKIIEAVQKSILEFDLNITDSKFQQIVKDRMKIKLEFLNHSLLHPSQKQITFNNLSIEKYPVTSFKNKIEEFENNFGKLNNVSLTLRQKHHKLEELLKKFNYNRVMTEN